MSATNTRPARNTEKPAPAAPATETSTAAAAAQSGATDPATTTAQTVTIEIAGLQVTLPVKFLPGHVLTENQSKVLDAAYQRQFTNNQNASAKSRLEMLGKATTDADKAKYAALTADGIAALYTDYEPNVGGGPRMGSMERMRLDAGWRAWVQLVKEHNTDGAYATISAAMGKPVAVGFTAPRKAKDVPAGMTKDQHEAAHTAAVEAEAAKKTAFVERLLSMPKYAERVQVQLDAIMAERGAAKVPAVADTVDAGDALL